MTRKTAIQIARQSEFLIYTTVEDIGQLIQLYAQLGFFEMEVFVTRELAKKSRKKLEKKGYYTRVTEFEALPNECRLYISWMSNL